MGWLSGGTSEAETSRGSATLVDDRSDIDSAPNGTLRHGIGIEHSQAHTMSMGEAPTDFAAVTAEREIQLKDECKAKDLEIQTSQKRVDSLERRIRERDTQMTSLKEEKSTMSRQIADLKNQLYQLQFEVEETTSDKADEASQWQAKLTEAQRELSDTKRAMEVATMAQNAKDIECSALQSDNDDLRRQMQSRGGLDEQVEALQKLLSTTKSANAQLTTQIAKEKASSVRSKQAAEQELATLRSTVKSRDESIQSLQSRLSKDQQSMTDVEKEMDRLRAENKCLVDKNGDVGNLWRINEEAKCKLDEKSDEIEELQSRLSTQLNLADQRAREIDSLKTMMRESEDETSRAEMLEGELKQMSDVMSQLKEEIDGLQSDLVLKNGRIASLERDIEDASSLLEGKDEGAPATSPSGGSSGNFARLRQEIERVTRERVQAENEHARQLAAVEKSKDNDIAKLADELATVRKQLEEKTESCSTLANSLEEVEKSRLETMKDLEKTRVIMDQLDAEEDVEMEAMHEQVRELENLNARLEAERNELRIKMEEREEKAASELLEAQQALIAVEKERIALTGDHRDEKIKSLSDQLAVSQEQVMANESKLNKALRENETVISDLRNEVSSTKKYNEELQDELDSLQLAFERGPTKRNYGMSIDPEWHEPDTISKLKVQVSTLSREKNAIEHELRAKIDSRDSTIAMLVLSSSKHEMTIGSLTAETTRLQGHVDSQSSENEELQQMKQLESKRRLEAESLSAKVRKLTSELHQTKKKLTKANEELECAKEQIDTASTMPELQDLAGRLAVAEQSQKMLMTENTNKLKERDAAIANLLQSVQANDSIISNLRIENERFRTQFNEAVDENRRLQQESEMFAQQIIDQDEEFNKLSLRLKEKTSEIASLKRDIASTSADVRQLKTLEVEVRELKEEKRLNVARINKLEVEMRDTELHRAEEDGYEVERLKLEVKSAISDKEMAEDKLTRQIESLRKLRNHAVDEYESKLQQRDKQITCLEKEILELKEQVDSNIFDEVDVSNSGQTNQQLAEERDMLLTKLEAKSEEIESLKTKIETLDTSELTLRLAHSERLRDELETDQAVFNARKDKELDRLRRQLADAREAQTARELEQVSLLKKLESENEEIQKEFNVRMTEKNSKIVALEQTLAAQEQVVGNMSNEMDQLQNGMEKISIQRRAEIEEMQEELMDYTGKAARLEREVTSLSMKLNDKKTKHKAEVSKLKDRISALESETPFERSARQEMSEERLREFEALSDKKDQLMRLNSSLKDDNEKLARKVGKLERKLSAKVEAESPSAKNNDKWRNVALQEQVAVLSQRVIELEEVQSSSTRAQKSSGTSILRTSRILPTESPVARTSIRDSPMSTPKASIESSLKITPVESSANAELLSTDVGDTLKQSNRASETPPPLPRPANVTPRSSPKSVRGSRTSRFSLTRKSSKNKVPPSPGAVSTTSSANYDF